MSTLPLPSTPPPSELDALLRAWLPDRTASWAVSSLGAVAEFHWVAGEPAHREDHRRRLIATARGALRLAIDGQPVVPLAYETPSADPLRWLHGVLLCVPRDRSGLARRRTLTEIGPDRDAVAPEHASGVLFDLGLGCANLEACVRTGDRALLATLRRHAGRPLLGDGAAAMEAIKRASPHRVFRSALGRIEVYSPIGSSARGIPTPVGPHTHVLPRLLASGRTHPATIPVPAGWMPALALYPASPVSDALGRPRPYDLLAHRRFEALLERFGHPEHRSEKERALAALEAGLAPQAYDPPGGRLGRAAVRVALRQSAAAGRGDAGLRSLWTARFDRARTVPRGHHAH